MSQQCSFMKLLHSFFWLFCPPNLHRKMEEMADRSQGTKELIASSDVSLRPSQRWHSLAGCSRGGPYSGCALRSEGAIAAKKSPCHKTNSSKFPKNCASSPKTMLSTHANSICNLWRGSHRPG